MDLVDWLRSETTSRGLLQKTVGEMLGLSEQLISKVFRGDRRLTGDELIILMRNFGYQTPLDEDTPATRIIRAAASLGEDQRNALAALLESMAPPKR